METLRETEIAPLELHLVLCEACQGRLTHIDQFIAAFCAAARKIAQAAIPGYGDLLPYCQSQERARLEDCWHQRS